MTDLRLGDCLELMKDIPDNVVIVSDPPFNIGYCYNSYTDKKPEVEYYKWLSNIIGNRASVIIHYPEAICRLAIELNKVPKRIVSWCYNSNTARQHRDIAFFGINPIMGQVRQPYKNPSDKRIAKRIENGMGGAALYDWWEINQVKNVSKENIQHPCVMPEKVMTNIIGVIPEDAVICDPFMGSGTTGVACVKLKRDFIGMEIDEKYFKIAEQRIKTAKSELTLW